MPKLDVSSDSLYGIKWKYRVIAESYDGHMLRIESKHGDGRDYRLDMQFANNTLDMLKRIRRELANAGIEFRIDSATYEIRPGHKTEVNAVIVDYDLLTEEQADRKWHEFMDIVYKSIKYLI